MLNICPACGSYRDDKIVVSNPDRVICPDCGASFPFLRRPLFILSGASGSGKSVVARILANPGFPATVLDSDILWDEAFSSPEKWPAYFNRWLRVCKNIGQSGKPVLLCGSGFGVPANLDQCVEVRYFAGYHILALVCEETQLAERLRNRPPWRNSGKSENIQPQLEFNRWFMQHADGGDSRLTLLDTTESEPARTTEQVTQWVIREMGIQTESIDSS